MIDELELSNEKAEEIVQKAIDFKVYTEDMPDTPKGKQEAAHEIVAFHNRLLAAGEARRRFAGRQRDV